MCRSWATLVTNVTVWAFVSGLCVQHKCTIHGTFNVVIKPKHAKNVPGPCLNTLGLAFRISIIVTWSKCIRLVWTAMWLQGNHTTFVYYYELCNVCVVFSLLTCSLFWYLQRCPWTFQSLLACLNFWKFFQFQCWSQNRMIHQGKLAIVNLIIPVNNFGTHISDKWRRKHQ